MVFSLNKKVIFVDLSEFSEQQLESDQLDIGRKKESVEIEQKPKFNIQLNHIQQPNRNSEENKEEITPFQVTLQV